MSLEHIHSIHRSPVSFFDSSWDIGSWDDFEHTLRAMERRMREMDRHFEQMFNQFLRLNPSSETRTSFRSRASDRLGFESGFGSRFEELENAGTAAAIEGGTTSGSVSRAIDLPKRSTFLRQRSTDWGFPDTAHPDPIITDKDGKRVFRLQYDVRQFKPEDIVVKTLDNKLEVTAIHNQGDESSKVHREYYRMCMLPQGLEAETLSSTFSPEGILSIEAPMPAIEPPTPKQPALPDKPVPIAIQHQKSVSGDGN